MKNNLLSERLVYNGESQTPTHLHLCTYNALVMQEVSGVNFQTVANSLNREQINWLQVHGLQNTEVIREICSHFEIDFLILQDILHILLFLCQIDYRDTCTSQLDMFVGKMADSRYGLQILADKGTQDTRTGPM